MFTASSNGFLVGPDVGEGDGRVDIVDGRVEVVNVVGIVSVVVVEVVVYVVVVVGVVVDAVDTVVL